MLLVRLGSALLCQEQERCSARAQQQQLCSQDSHDVRARQQSTTLEHNSRARAGKGDGNEDVAGAIRVMDEKVSSR